MKQLLSIRVNPISKKKPQIFIFKTSVETGRQNLVEWGEEEENTEFQDRVSNTIPDSFCFQLQQVALGGIAVDTHYFLCTLENVFECVTSTPR